MVAFPNKIQVENREDLSSATFEAEKPNRLIFEYCSEIGIRCLDLLPVMASEYEQTGQALFYPIDRHPTEKGYRVAAERCRMRGRSEPQLRGDFAIGRRSSATWKHLHLQMPPEPMAVKTKFHSMVSSTQRTENPDLTILRGSSRILVTPFPRSAMNETIWSIIHDRVQLVENRDSGHLCVLSRFGRRTRHRW